METIKQRIKNDPLSISELNPIEAVILTYMINIFTRHKYHDITPRELYDIIDCFEKNTDKIKELMVEAEQIKKIIKSAMDHITNDNKSIIWNIEHILCYGGTTEDFGINNTVPIIGYGPKYRLSYYVTYRLFAVKSLGYDDRYYDGEIFNIRSTTK